MIRRLVWILSLAVGVCAVCLAAPLRVGVLPDTDSLPLLLAERRGLFAAHGIEVKLELFRSARERDSALQAGALDGAVSDVLAAAFAQTGGFPVAILSRTDGNYRLLVSPKSTIRSVVGLKGRQMALSRNTIIEYVTDRICERSGLDPELVKKVSIPGIPTRLEMLAADRIDAATLPEPLASQAVLQGARELSSASTLGIDAGVILFTRPAVTDRRAELARFRSAYDDATAALAAGLPPDELAALLKSAGFPDSSASSLKLPSYRPAALPAPADVDAAVSWLLERKLIPRRVTYAELAADLAR